MNEVKIDRPIWDYIHMAFEVGVAPIPNQILFLRRVMRDTVREEA